MGVEDGKLLQLDRSGSGQPEVRDLVEQEKVIGDLLRKLERDVANVLATSDTKVSEPVPARVPAVIERRNAELSTVPVSDLSHDEMQQPLPRLLTGVSPTVDVEKSQRREELDEYKGAAYRGFCVGLILIVPIVIWVSTSMLSAPGGPKSGTGIDGRKAVTASLAEEHAEVRLPLGANEAVPALAARPKVVALPGPILADARQLIGTGDIQGARRLLASPEVRDFAPAVMALAETYDPNMLAAWNALDVSPDVETARQLYARAAQGGAREAERRLSALR